ncbi:MAG: hypothetical protein QW369_04250 [Desulfurococcaceae archaeon]
MRKIVVKISGNLVAYPDKARELLNKIYSYIREHLVILVPGGSVFADLVRSLQGSLGFSDEVAHWMAVKSMEVYGIYLSSLHKSLKPVESVDEAYEAFYEGSVPLLMPYRILRKSDKLPKTWSVTSDSIAIYVGYLIGADIVALSKVVDGLMGPGGYLIKLLKASDVPRDQDVVDGYAAYLAREYCLRVAIFNGLKPWILDDIVYSREGLYTLILPE